MNARLEEKQEKLNPRLAKRGEKINTNLQEISFSIMCFFCRRSILKKVVNAVVFWILSYRNHKEKFGDVKLKTAISKQ